MPNRRDVLKGAIAAGGVAALGNAETARANWGMPLPQTEFDGRSLINYSRAYQIMDELELDGLIAMNPVNVFYLSNYLGYNVKIQTPNPSFAVFPRDENKSAILVAGFGDLWNLSEGGAEYPQVIPYSLPFGVDNFDPANPMNSPPIAAPPFSKLFQTDDAGLAPLEKTWLSYDDRFEGEMMPSSEYALIRALKEAGLEKATVAVDDMRISLSLEKLGHTSTTCVEGDNTFRKIRVVKSDVEIGHMRRIAQVNQIATMNMIGQLGVGATEADIDRLFRIEAAKLGASVTWTVLGSIGGLTHGEMVEGEPILIDSVTQINYYHGDFGRTVVVGEPSKKVLERTQMLKTVWHAALDMMKPGVKYSEIEAVARKAISGDGQTMPVMFVNPHSVGLQHTDEPYRDNLPFYAKDDLVLQENMTLTVDFPCLEPGWGNCHLEDLVVITQDGVEALGTIDDPLVVI